jgi:uncharacterized protein DUF397
LASFNGTLNCDREVAVLADLSALVWRRSSFSGATDGTECVEVALPPGAVVVRDSKDADGAVLHVGRSGWLSLLGSVGRRRPTV